ncbi:OmpA family protein [Glaciecola petra]|uniref:OmpA family protein n=1 Tax=Glaciecola petra TaxID=3075602 RepID=A0ABU2ZUC1_9ALTE|nr:OmpA family protein [Aestuariibacter sp. P117]MDT0596185.1 OmpA family protein [Aestuariibacter sp. P117]
MKKLTLLTAALLSASVFVTNAQEAPPYENWVGGFVQYYSADASKIEPIGGLDDGEGFGAELGFRFDPSWAVRFEIGRVLIDSDPDNRGALADDGTQLGADVMYFLENDAAYLFGGLREQSISESYRMASLGIGKHWEIDENFRLISEVATYYDFGQAHNEFSVKLGLAYIFGKNDQPAPRPDTDGDGVYDAVDRCPTTPAGTTVDATGCNVDLDGDGVLNAQDMCPTTPSGVEVDVNGCEIKDSDNDGVLDEDDSCPNTAAGVQVNAKGCAVDLDTDNDGVLDSKDSCLGTPMTDKVDASGCSIFEQKEVSVALDILFDNNSSVVNNPDSAQINEFVAFMQRYPNTSAVIEGHTSSLGQAEYNQFLSEKRAKSVRAVLIDTYGIDADRLTAVGYGETRLKDTSNTREAHRINRRIEVSVTATVETKATR